VSAPQITLAQDAAALHAVVMSCIETRDFKRHLQAVNGFVEHALTPFAAQAIELSNNAEAVAARGSIGELVAYIQRVARNRASLEATFDILLTIQEPTLAGLVSRLIQTLDGASRVALSIGRRRGMIV
jgi:hypothetical protein